MWYNSVTRQSRVAPKKAVTSTALTAHIMEVSIRKNAMIRIPLTRGYFATIDDIDSDLAALKWYAFVAKKKVYAARKIKRNRVTQTIFMHKTIMERMHGEHLPVGLEVDHMNSNGLDNSRQNLRLATKQEQRRNSLRRSDNTSGYKGVIYIKDRNRWFACIHMDGKPIGLGEHPTAELAAIAYNHAALKYFGEFASFNPVDGWETVTVREKRQPAHYPGVYFHKGNKKWVGRYQKDGYRYITRDFDAPEDAYEALCKLKENLDEYSDNLRDSRP